MFEDHSYKNYGNKFKFTESDLKKLISNTSLKTKLVYVSACHSDKIAKIFLDAKVRNIIYIN